MVASLQELRRHYGPLLPWAALAGSLAAVWMALHLVIIVPAQSRLDQIETDWRTARQRLDERIQAKQVLKDLAYVLAMLPVQREFAQMPLSITDEARRNHVSLPGLAYTSEKSEGGLASKAVFHGPVTGRYEDLRRFIHNMEAADRLLFIENLDVLRSDYNEKQFKKYKKGEVVTFNLRIATYIKQGPARAANGKDATVRSQETASLLAAKGPKE